MAACDLLNTNAIGPLFVNGTTYGESYLHVTGNQLMPQRRQTRKVLTGLCPATVLLWVVETFAGRLILFFIQNFPLDT
jgi:hypothetical protein